MSKPHTTATIEQIKTVFMSVTRLLSHDWQLALIQLENFQVEDEEGRIHLLINVPIDAEDGDRWCLWRPVHTGLDSRSIFQGVLVEE